MGREGSHTREKRDKPVRAVPSKEPGTIFFIRVPENTDPEKRTKRKGNVGGKAETQKKRLRE